MLSHQQTGGYCGFCEFPLRCHLRWHRWWGEVGETAYLEGCSHWGTEELRKTEEHLNRRRLYRVIMLVTHSFNTPRGMGGWCLIRVHFAVLPSRKSDQKISKSDFYQIVFLPTSLLRRLQTKTLPDGTPPIDKKYPLTKMAVTFEPVIKFWCPSGFRKFMIAIT